MRWVRSLPPTLFLLSAGQDLVVRILRVPPPDDSPVLMASHGGSTLPWWTPIAVSLVLLFAGLAYWWRHRPRRPSVDPGDPGALDTGEAALETDAPVVPGLPGPEDPGAPPEHFGGVVHPVPSA